MDHESDQWQETASSIKEQKYHAYGKREQMDLILQAATNSYTGEAIPAVKRSVQNATAHCVVITL